LLCELSNFQPAQEIELTIPSMLLSHHVPWQLKIVAKLVLARMPFDYRLWKKAGVFELGAMEQPEYALSVFRRHFDAANFSRKTAGFVALELGPGDSLFSALIVRAFGGSRTYLVDVGPFAAANAAFYHKMEVYLRQLGMHPPNLQNCFTLDDVMAACSMEYFTGGLASLRKIPSESVDFIWSHAVLQHVRRDEFLPTLLELRRIQRPGGVASHSIFISDILGGKLNDLRFSDRVWESSFMANSGFYTNRIRYTELLRLFRLAGFAPEVRQVARWQALPTPRRKMAHEFAELPEEELQVSGFDVLLR
jgi:SAM-dependent methyltransferase